MKFLHGRSIRVLEMNLNRRTLITSANTKDTLFSRLVAYHHPNISMLPILDQWVKEERGIEVDELRKIIKQFRKYRRHKHALQISEWMAGKSFLDVSIADAAVQLDLIAKVHGVKQAEEYFHSIPQASKNVQIYGALLNCYANAKLLDKAEAVMQKMRQLGSSIPINYNVMMNLYYKLGMFDEIDCLVEEMEEKAVLCDRFTYTIRLNAYASALDVDRMEKLLMKMEADPLVNMDWHAYVAVARGFIRAGDMDKALAMLRKSEQLTRVGSRKLAYEVLMTLYASMGNKDDMYRIWNLYKRNERFSNLTYVTAISSLDKLNDLDGAEKVWEEWKDRRISFDHRVPNMLITSYCKKGLLEKAESLVRWLIESGNEPNASTWSRMALGYHKNSQMDKAVESINKCIMLGEPGWKPPFYTLIACLDHLKEKGDSDMIERMKASLAELGFDCIDVNEDSEGETIEENPELKSV